MLDNINTLFNFYLSSVADFLLSDPIVYFTGAAFSLVVIKILKSLFNLTR